jgi:hypothetical protein
MNSCTQHLRMGCCWGWVRCGDGLRATAGFEGSVLIRGRLPCGFACAAIIGATKEAEESGSAPSRAGDGACYRRQAGIAPSLPIEEAIAGDRDGVALSLIVADQYRPDFELPRPRASLTCQGVEEHQACTIETAEGQLLHSARDHSRQQVFAQSRRRGSTERHPPAAPKRIRSACPQPLDLSLDRGRVRPLRAHDHALGAAAVLPLAIR